VRREIEDVQNGGPLRIRLLASVGNRALERFTVGLPTRPIPARRAGEGTSGLDSLACASGWYPRDRDPVRKPSMNRSNEGLSV
jgi:hypothetical protein